MNRKKYHRRLRNKKKGSSVMGISIIILSIGIAIRLARFK